MQIKELIKKAKVGNKQAFDDLVEYYEEYFADMVVRKNNDEGLRNKAKEELPELIRIYLKRNYTQPMHDYLGYYSISCFTDKERLSDTRDMEIVKLKEIYTKRLVKMFEEFNTVLTEEELKKYAFNFISNTIDTLSTNRDSLTTRLGTVFARQRRFVNTQEDLLIRFILQEGYNINIINFFEAKYKFILKDYENELSYIYLCKKYKDIIINVIKELNSNKTSIERAIRNKVHRLNVDYTKEIVNTSFDIRNDNSRINEVYNAHLVLKQRVYDLYIDKVSMPKEKMLEVIDKNYDLYFKAYINGVCAKPLGQYILTRFSEYFNKIKLPRQLTNEELEKRQTIFNENEDCIDKKMRKLNINYPYDLARNELMNCYVDAIDTYFRKESITDARVIIGYKLKKKAEELKILYSDENIKYIGMLMKKSIVSSKIDDTDIVEEIIDNLLEYYISNKMNNEKPFESFIIDAVENFDIEEYLRIKEIKDHINLKVLRRPNIK